MKAQELRLGNKIINGIGEEFSVNAYTIGNFDWGQHTLGAYKPIPINNDWLMLNGFDKDCIKNKYSKKCGEYLMEISVNCFSGSLSMEQTWFVSILTGFGSQPVTVTKQFIHQLQNLWFSLTDEELDAEPTRTTTG